MTASEIRALFAVAQSGPRWSRLAGGMPYICARSARRGRRDARRAGRRHGADGAAVRHPARATLELREQICEVMALEGIDRRVARRRRGDRRLAAGARPGHPGLPRPGRRRARRGRRPTSARSASFRPPRPRCVHVADGRRRADPGGAGRRRSTRSPRAGRRAKFLYTVPNFHNPAGVTLARERRAEILDSAQRAGLLVIEDDPYGLLGFDGRRRARAAGPAPRAGHLPRLVLQDLRARACGSAGRCAPHAVRDKLVLAQRGAGALPAVRSPSSPSPTYLATQPWREQIKVFRELYRERRDACSTRWTS